MTSLYPMSNDDNLFETKAAAQEFRDYVKKNNPTTNERRNHYNLLCGIESAIRRGIQGFAHGMSKGKYVRPPWNNEEFVRNIAIEIKGLEYVLRREEDYLAKKRKEEKERKSRELEQRQRNQALDDQLDRFLQ
jgi:response regulator RpfG family c-di-GMP phosphodiesterase